MSKRRLAAIIFTDIVGYDSLLKEDEKKTFEILRKNQRIHKRLIKKFNGRWLKEMGGSILASFNSNIDAVMCAVYIQKATEEIEIPVRIGIHLGDVIFEKKDVLGDGVNIASRIQNVINTSGIVVSEKVYSDIKNKEGLEIESLGTKTLKGVDSPVGIYIVSCHEYNLLDYTIDTGELVRPLSFGRTTIVLGIIIIALLAYAVYYFLPETGFTDEPEKSVLVLPFDNYLESDTLDYLVDGMHNELNFNVAKISALRVLSATTANTFKNTEKSIKEISSEVAVNNVIRPAILCSGDSICLRIEIYSTEKEEQIWVKEYHEETSQILKLFNTITKEISDEIDINLRPQEEMMLTESRSVDRDAYEAYLKGRLNLDIFTPQSLLTAIKEFEKAIDIDPAWAAPYAGIAEAYAYKNQFGWGSRSNNILMIYKNLNKAQEIDPNSFYFHYTNAVIAVWTEFDWNKGEREFKKAIELNPSNVRCRLFYANLLTILRRTDDALKHGKISVELDPVNPMTLGLYGIVLLENHECEEAIVQLEKGLSIQPRHGVCYGNYWAAVVCLGDYDRWFNNLKKNNIKFWEEHELTERYEEAYYERGWNALLEEIIKANDEIFGMTNHNDSASRMQLYFQMGDYDKVIDFLENFYERDGRDPNLPYQSTKGHYDLMKDNPRYIELLRKMNLPVD